MSLKEKIIKAKSFVTNAKNKTTEKITAIKAYVTDGVWEEDLSPLPLHKRIGVRLTRFFHATFSGFSRNKCALHAASLTHFTLLSLVPLLCLLILFARTCGAGGFAREKINLSIDGMIESFEKGPEDLPEFLTKNQQPEQINERRKAAEDFAKQMREISNSIFDRIEQFDVRGMGVVGVVMLLVTVISMLTKVEKAFNEVWQVDQLRGWIKKVFLYTFVSLVLPLLAALALSMPILGIVRKVLDATLGALSFTKWAGDALMAVLDSRLFGIAFTLFFATASFTFILKVFPNRKVPFRSAAEGGLITALLFIGCMKLCAMLQVGIGKISAIYGSLTFLPILLTWICISWQILLLGCNMTYALYCIHHGLRPGAGDNAAS